MSSPAQDDEDAKGLKLGKIRGHYFQVWMWYIPKISEILMWLAFSDKIYLIYILV